MRRVVGTALVIALVAALGFSASMAFPYAQARQDLGSEAVATALSQNAGKRVKVKLVSGQDLEGQVGQISSHAVVLTGLTGSEFYNATVRLDQVAAVIVRAPGK